MSKKESHMKAITIRLHPERDVDIIEFLEKYRGGISSLVRASIRREIDQWGKRINRIHKDGPSGD